MWFFSNGLGLGLIVLVRGFKAWVETGDSNYEVSVNFNPNSKINLFFYIVYFYYYLWVLLYFLVIFISLTVL